VKPMYTHNLYTKPVSHPSHIPPFSLISYLPVSTVSLILLPPSTAAPSLPVSGALPPLLPWPLFLLWPPSSWSPQLLPADVAAPLLLFVCRWRERGEEGGGRVAGRGRGGREGMREGAGGQGGREAVTVTLSYCHTIILSHCHTVLLSYCHTVLLSHCHTVIGASLSEPQTASKAVDSVCHRPYPRVTVLP